MKFEVLKPFTWNGQELETGDSLEIPDESTKIGPLSRSKFMRFAGEGGNVVKAADRPPVKEVASEIAKAEGGGVGVADRPDPKRVVREAKAKAAAKKG